MRRESSHEIVNLMCGGFPVDAALLPENLRSRGSDAIVLRLRNDRPCFNLLHSLNHQPGTKQRKTIMNGSGIVIRSDLKA